MTSQNIVRDERLELLRNWSDYFEIPPKESFDETDSVHLLIHTLFEVFTKNPDLYMKHNYPTYTECLVDIRQLLKDFEDDENQLLNIFQSEPQNWINSLNLSLSTILNKKIVTRIFNISPINNIKSTNIGTYISIQGTIITTGAPKLILEKACFRCVACDQIEKTMVNEDGSVNSLKQCKQCSSTNIKLDRNKSDVALYQKLKISDQNLINIDIEVRDNLVSSFISGDTIIVHGIVKTYQDDSKQTLFIKYIKAYHVMNVDESIISDKFTRQEQKIVNELRQNDEMFNSLLFNFCPTIYGHEIVKAGILLSLVGGCSGERSTSHCLLVGDPGQGKSQLLKFANLIAPKSILVSGTAVSQCGLTCSINKKDDDTVIDSGALVLADQGVCCLDEIDKMGGQHCALLEAMEQQTITIAKQAVMCQFYARTTIIATANPQYGHFQKNKSIIDNLKIQTTLLSRFDLIHLMIDEPDKERDQKLSEHIMNIHNHKKNRTDFEEEKISTFKYRTLNDRLKQQCQSEYQLNSAFMKKIINHLKEYNPQLTQGANKIIINYYLKIRQSNTLSLIPITTRQLESLIRLSQAKAKLRMKNYVDEDDAQFALDLFEESRFDCFNNQIGSQINNKANPHNVATLSKPKQIQILMDSLHSMCMERDSFVFQFEDLKQIARKINLQVGDLGDLIERLNLETLLIKKCSQTYELNYKR